jgi:hypothetical protein
LRKLIQEYRALLANIHELNERLRNVNTALSGIRERTFLLERIASATTYLASAEKHSRLRAGQQSEF